MSGKADIIIPIIEVIIKTDDIDSPKEQFDKWRIGYSHERLTPTSNRLFIWKVNHVEDAKVIVDRFIKQGVQQYIYNDTGAHRIEWVFLYHL